MTALEESPSPYLSEGDGFYQAITHLMTWWRTMT